MKIFLGTLLAAIGIYIVQSRAEINVEAQYASLIEYFKNNKIGYSSNFALYRSSFSSSTEPVAVVFGFLDSWDACNKFAELLNAEKDRARYYCLPLN